MWVGLAVSEFVMVMLMVSLEGGSTERRGLRCAGVCRPRKDCPTARQQPHLRPTCPLDHQGQRLVCCERQGRRRPGDTAKEMCKEYGKYVFVDEGVVPGESIDQCTKAGIPTIVGGESAELGEFEHMASIGYGEKENIKYECGGSLISPDFVLTAAHCFNKGLPRWVLLGELNLDSDDDGAEPQLREISRIHRHGGYKWPREYNDIALLRLSEPAEIETYVRPACLYVEGSVPGFDGNLTATGWGLEDDEGSKTGWLQKVSLQMQPYSVCNALYNRFDRKHPRGILDISQFCAGGFNTGQDTCLGDSGGPVQVLTLDSPNYCMYHIVGITSFGKGNCGVSPAVYTRVSAYLKWIEDIVWPQQ